MDSFLKKKYVFKHIIVLLIKPLGDWWSGWVSRILGKEWSCIEGLYQLESLLLSISGFSKGTEF